MVNLDSIYFVYIKGEIRSYNFYLSFHVHLLLQNHTKVKIETQMTISKEMMTKNIPIRKEYHLLCQPNSANDFHTME